MLAMTLNSSHENLRTSPIKCLWIHCFKINSDLRAGDWIHSVMAEEEGQLTYYCKSRMMNLKMIYEKKHGKNHMAHVLTDWL
jgi:hypothetical protein